jgi:hypothetical protein
MKFVRAVHGFDSDGTLLTFGIDEDAKVWLVTNTDGTAEGIETEYFGFSAQVFWELIHALESLAVAGIRLQLSGDMFPPMEDTTDDEPRIIPGAWHGTGIGPDGVVIATDAVSAYPPVPLLRELDSGDES